VTRLLATSDLHIGYGENREIVDGLRPESDTDWLIVAGDVGERSTDIDWALTLLSQRFHTVVWSPGNHELWTTKDDPLQIRGEERYQWLVARCRELGVHTPEDPYPVWQGPTGPMVVAPLFLLYDYSWRTPAAEGKSLEEALRQAREAGVVCTDEYFLHPDPYPSRQAWCADRLKISTERLDAIPEDHGTILMSHWPLHRHPTAPLYWPEFALWCGSTKTEDWHLRYRAEIAVYGHLHIPRTTEADGVRFEEVSLGYPREWRKRARGAVPMRRILWPS
jgi:predicted phosphodiesterase